MKYILELNDEQLSHLKRAIDAENNKFQFIARRHPISNNWNDLYDKIMKLPYQQDENPDFGDMDWAKPDCMI